MKRTSRIPTNPMMWPRGTSSSQTNHDEATFDYSHFLGFSATSERACADEDENTRKMQEAIRTISDPEVYGKFKHEAMMVLQELKDPRSVDDLYENIDFESTWGRALTQRTTEAFYPATHALILIGKPSIEGAERYLRINQSISDMQLGLIVHVVREVFRNESDEKSDRKFPKADAQLLEWLKENYTIDQLKYVASNMRLPLLKEYLETLPEPSELPAPKPDKKPSEREDAHLPQHRLNHNLMRNGTSPEHIITSSKRLYPLQENMLLEDILIDP